LRQHHPASAVHLHPLAVIIHFVQKPFLRRIEVGEPGQLLLDLAPLLHRKNLRHLAVLAGDVKLGAVLLLDGALEFCRHLEASLFVHARWMVSAKHVFGPVAPGISSSCAPLTRRPSSIQRRRRKAHRFLVHQSGFSGLFGSSNWNSSYSPATHRLTLLSTYNHFRPHATPKLLAVN